MAEVIVRNGGGEASLRMRMTAVSPGIYSAGALASVIHANGVLVSESAPARAGEELVLFASGLGAVDPPVANGYPAPSLVLSQTLLPPMVWLGGFRTEMRFSGLTPGLVGVYQVNFVVPAGIPGTVPIVLEIGDATSNVLTLSVLP